MTSAANPLFCQANGSPIVFFIEPNEIPQSTRKHLTRTIELYGGAICMNASQAHIILVVRGTAEAEKYANLWAPPPESKPVLDYIWIKTCISKGCLLHGAHHWDGLLVPYDEGEVGDIVMQPPAPVEPAPQDLVDGTIAPALIAGTSSPGPSLHQNGAPSSTAEVARPNTTLNGNGAQPPLGTDVFRTMTGGFPSQSILHQPGPTTSMPNAFNFQAQIPQNSIPVAFIQPQMFAQLPFLYNAATNAALPLADTTSQQNTVATPSSTLVSNDRHMSVTDGESSPSHRSIPTRKEFAASRKLLSSSKSSRALLVTADASPRYRDSAHSNSEKSIRGRASRQSLAKNTSTPTPAPARNRTRMLDSRDRSGSPPSERRRALRSAATEPVKFFVTHDGDALRFYIPMDVENHMELLESLRAHGGRGTPIGYCDYVITDTLASHKLLPQIRQLGVRAVKPGWVEACIEAEELLAVDDWEINVDDGLPPDPLDRSSFFAATPIEERSRKRKAPEDGKNSTTPVKQRILNSLANITPEQRESLPASPKVLVPHGVGYRFTHADSQFLIEYANARFSQDPQLSITTILKEVAYHTNTSHSYESWKRYYKDQIDVWRLYISFPSEESASLDTDDAYTERPAEQEDETEPNHKPPSKKSTSATTSALPNQRPVTPSVDIDMEAGSGQKYTSEEIEFLRDFVAWSYMHNPATTRTELIRKLAEKVPRHSTGSWSSLWFVHKVELEDIIKRSKAYAAENLEQGEQPMKKDTDGRQTRDTPAPEPPTTHKYNSNGSAEYPPEDYIFLMDFVRWAAARHPGIAQGHLVQLLVKHADYHSARGWDNFIRKNKTDVTAAIRQAPVEEPEQSPAQGVGHVATSSSPRVVPDTGDFEDEGEDDEDESGNSKSAVDDVLANEGGTENN